MHPLHGSGDLLRGKCLKKLFPVMHVFHASPPSFSGSKEEDMYPNKRHRYIERQELMVRKDSCVRDYEYMYTLCMKQFSCHRKIERKDSRAGENTTTFVTEDTFAEKISSFQTIRSVFQ